ncbi:DUF1194 domain-containing protein [Aurantimonas sp. Leaf443]|uniref:DUF1194 domain-containing protein n=1 Tax=Aurantimonas sp. Leaf443 TaxID=1736378 RepID=UPI0006F6C21E|nr:DUF1194 domain-containing protein [Aurantimonas sp. Leaf443]KQT86144.1 hypothetical protein ASG48_06080 [Aurantimonas sp. Leaf443]
MSSVRPSRHAASILLAALLAAGPAMAQGTPRGLGTLGAGSGEGGVKVDVELVLAVDVSWSMDRSEQEIQREGYAAAFRSPEVQKAIMEGGFGKVAVTYVEWAGTFSQSIVVPWTVISSKESADAFAYALVTEEPERERRTSISAAIDYVVPLFSNNGYDAPRRVIDLSGDGPNNQGRSVLEARDAAIARGITINGLPLMTSGDRYSNWGSIPHLDRYYEACVIGGPRAFMIPVNDWSQFPEAVRRKLVLELAGGWPPETAPDADAPAIVPAQADASTDCLVGERLWNERQRKWMGDQ